MSTSSMDLSVWVRLKDRFSGKLSGILRGMNRLGSAAKRMGAIAGIVAGISFAGPAQEASAFDQNLRDIAVTSNIARDAVDDWISSQRSVYEDLALLSGQFSTDVSRTAGELRQAGLADSAITDLMPSISDAATAASADIGDIGKVAFALNKTLGVTAAQMPDALGMLVVAGKEGRFELKEMAKYFPQLTALAKGFGVQGKEAVAMLSSGLQVAMFGASDPAQAANNYKNFLEKILAPDTIKRFADNGVDIKKVMENAAIQGINPIEAVIAKTQDLTGVSTEAINTMMAAAKAGGLEGAEALASVQEQLERIGAAGKLSELFGDQQVKAFVLPFLANIEEYKRIKAAVEGGNSSIISADKAIQMDGPKKQRTIFRELGVQSARDVGDAFNSWLPMINTHLLDLRGHVNALETAMPGMKKYLLALGAGGVLAAVGLGVLGFVLPAIATGIAALLSPIGLIILAVVAVAATLATVAYFVMKHWDAIGPYFDVLWDGVKLGAQLAFDGVKATWSGIETLFASFMEGFAPDFDLSNLTIDNLKSEALVIFANALHDISAAWETLKGFGAGFGTGFMAELGPALEPLTRLGEPLTEMAESVGAILGYFKPISAAIGDLVGSLGKLDGESDGARALGEILGQFAGNTLGIAAAGIKLFVDDVAAIVEVIEQIFALMKGEPVDWTILTDSGKEMLKSTGKLINSILKTVGDLVDMKLTIDWATLGNMLDASIDSIKSKVSELIEWFRGLPGKIIGAIGNVDIGSLFKFGRISSFLSGKKGDEPAKTGGGQSSRKAVAQNSSVQVGGQINVKVDGPGKVTSTKSSNSNVPINPGRTVGTP